jgi:hypothetical protein
VAAIFGSPTESPSYLAESVIVGVNYEGAANFWGPNETDRFRVMNDDAWDVR